ncbi:MAG: hypothetical protein IJB71_04595 [Bacilli bacterium]|nr:hypothetical protein [Bacilli bacterium]
MRDEDIEILEDFSDNFSNQNPINNNQNINPSTNTQPVMPPTYNTQVPDYAEPINPVNNNVIGNQNASVNEFEKMVTEANQPEPIVNPEPVVTSNPVNPSIDYSNDYSNYQNNNFNDLNYATDANNELVESTGADTDLTITAVYPNGFIVPDQEEQEDNRVVKPQKSKTDLYLIIIVAVLAIILVVMLIMFYL